MENEPSFKESFDSARGDGKSEFTWKGKRYTTELAKKEDKKDTHKGHSEGTEVSNRLKFRSERPLATKAGKFGEWLLNSYPELNVSSGDRKTKGSHSHGDALDITGIENLSEDKQTNIFRRAKAHGLSVGKELEGIEGVQGWSGSHYHIGQGKYDFFRGDETGSANNSKLKRSKNEQKEHIKWASLMSKLKEEGLVNEEKFGPSDSELKGESINSDSEEYGPSDSELKSSIIDLRELASEVTKQPLTEEQKKADFHTKMSFYAQMNPEADPKELREYIENVDKYFEDFNYDPDKRVASTDNELPQMSMPTESKEESSEEVVDMQYMDMTDLGGKDPEVSSFLHDIENFTFEGMGEDLVNKFVDRNAIGFITEAAISAFKQSDEVDPNFNIKEQDNELYTQMTDGLDTDDVVNILDNSFNRADFIKNASLAQGRVKRIKEMNDYSQNHPVLSGVNTVGSMLTEGAAFMPVSSLAAAAARASKITKLAQLSSKGIKGYVAGEAIEQGLQEVIWSKYGKDYEFDPAMFAAGVGLGVGLKMVTGSPEADKAFREFMRNEDGFINIATKEGKRLVDEVAENVNDSQAIALAERITKKKIKVANTIRKDLDAKRSSLVRRLSILDDKIKTAEFTDDVKKFKGQKQRVARGLKKFDKKLPKQLDELTRGTHPKLLAEVNPEFSISKIAKELDIPSDVVNSLEKTRKFLGLDGPNIDPNFVLEGEKGYMNVMRENLKEMVSNKRLNANETLKYAAGSDTVKSLDGLPVIGKLQIGNKLNTLASTDGLTSRFLFNKGNLVSSENPHVASFYNFMASDGMGRQGASRIRAIESQQKYANIYGGDLLNLYHTHGSDIYEEIVGSNIKAKFKGVFSVDNYEDTVEPLLKERLLDPTGVGFREKYGDAIADSADKFYNDFNALNKRMVDRAKELGVEGVDFDSVDGWFHRSWDFRKARAVDAEDLQDTVFRAMKSHAETLGVKSIDEDVLRKEAKNFAFGIRSADITTIDGLQSNYIQKLEKLMDKADGVETPTIKNEVDRLKKLKAKADAGDLANRVQMDVTQTMSNGRPLSDLFEDNIVNTQKRHSSRMAARIAAAEHGIKNIDDLDDWVQDAYEAEIKSLAARGVKNPKEEAKFVKEAMQQDVQSFKYGGMTGLHDLSDDTANDFIRLVKKYNYARLMQYTGISSIAEMGGTLVEAGVSNTIRESFKYMRETLNDLFQDNPDMYTGRLYDELRSITGVGMEDFSFSTKGMSKANRIFESGTINTLEKGVDVLGRVAHGPFSGIEKAGRRITANSLAIKWGNHFKGTESGGVLGAFFGSNGMTNRVLENSGLGKIDINGKFIANDTYKNIKSSMIKHASYDDSGRLVRLNLDKWDNSTAHAFGDVIQMQSNHIMVNPDSTTMALWQSTPIGQILNQFRSFTVNATTKVMGQAVGNAAISSNRGDHSEMIKAGQKIFWGTTLGMLSVGVRQGIQRAGGDREVDLFDEGLIKAAAIGFSRASVAGNLPTIADSMSGFFGFDPMFEKTSSTGRSKNFFNLATTPTGQAVGGIYGGVEKAVQGDVKKGGMQLLKSSPVYRQVGLQQIFNFVDDE